MNMKIFMKKTLPFLAAIIIACIAIPFITGRCPHGPEPVTAQPDAENGGSIARIKERGVLLVGTTGDYRPLTFMEPDTEITEAPYYVSTDSRLAAPLLGTPFTNSQIGVLMSKGNEDLLQLVNSLIDRMKSDGTLRVLHEKYGLNYVIVPISSRGGRSRFRRLCHEDLRTRT